MRGTLEVVDPDAPDAPPIAEGESDFTHLDIDSAHEAEFYPLTRPSVERGRAIAHRTGQSAPDDLRGQSPSVVYQDIRREQAAASLSDEETWDLVAHYWSTTTTPERLATGRALYDKNCAACHGATGGGDGPGGRYLEKRPVDFTRAQGMAGGSSDIYYAKIRRGGMGTGMPYWGPVFSEEETWSIVDYLWTFLFDDAREEN
jgi:mono/diheme cytochrome c family protein